MKTVSEWSNWESGDCLFPQSEHATLSCAAILSRLAPCFRRVLIDWIEGERWATARIQRASEAGYTGQLLEAENTLRGHTALVSISDDIQGDKGWVQFYITPNTSSIELHYEDEADRNINTSTARKLAHAIGYEFAEF